MDDFSRHAGVHALYKIGNDHFFEHDFVVLELVATGAADDQPDFFQVLPGATGFEQFAADLVKVRLLRVVRPEVAPPAELAVAEVLWLVPNV